LIKYLGKKIKIKIDRPLGSKHPNHELIYPINYGYIEKTVSGDGDEIDVYVLGEFEPLSEYEGIVIGVIKRANDKEDKLVVAKTLNSYNKEQIKALTEFQERFFESEIITYDHLKSSSINELKEMINKFSKERNWREKENVKNLAMAMVVEASELLEIFQWVHSDEADNIKNSEGEFEHLKEEIADVFWYLIRICNHFDIDLYQAVIDKSVKNAKKYPRK